jgi:hypothetical protein
MTRMLSNRPHSKYSIRREKGKALYVFFVTTEEGSRDGSWKLMALSVTLNKPACSQATSSTALISALTVASVMEVAGAIREVPPDCH